MGAGCSKVSSTENVTPIKKAEPPVATVQPKVMVEEKTPSSVEVAKPSPAAAPSSASKTSGSEKKLTILHFNDVYNIEPADRDPVGGASRFAHVVKSEAACNPLVVFSGDCFNPSLMSTVTKGEQMVPVLNGIGVHVAAVGNHDFDWGTENLVKLSKQCNFPWLMANVLDAQTGKPYAEAKDCIMLDWHGVKVGLVGLVEEEWLATLGSVNLEELKYVDFVETGRKLARELKAQGAEVLIAVTHMRVPNDKKLANEVEEFDIIAGGHDHHYEIELMEKNGNLVLKSGTDFRDMTKVEITVPMGGRAGRPKMVHTRLSMVKSIPEDPEVAEIVNRYLGLMGAAMDTVIGETLCELDGRFTTVRIQESNLANLVVDIWRQAAGVDVVIVNGGSFRSDIIHPAGPLKVKDLVAVLPMIDTTMILEVTGQVILQALENGVSMWPKLEGRFPQVSGVRFKFDPRQEPGYRIIEDSVYVGEALLEKEKTYTLTTKTYMANGKDGYDCFLGQKVLVDDEVGIVIPTCFRNHFTHMDVISKWDPDLIVNNLIHKFIDKITEGLTEEDLPAGFRPSPSTPISHMLVPKGICVPHPEKPCYVINPGLDGRIVNVAK